METLTIAKAARQAGVGVETIRFYERRGLIEQPRKLHGSGYRTYSTEQIRRIKFIRQAQEIGFSLKEIRELLSLRADPSADCAAVRAQAVTKLDEVKRKIEELRRIGAALEVLIAACPGRGAIEACTILDALADPHRGTVPPNGSDKSASACANTQTIHRRTNGGQTSKADGSMKSLTLKIEGMNCDSCAANIKTLLKRQTGVKTADVIFDEGEVRILYDPTAIDENALIEAVERPGFRVTNRSSGS